LSKICDPVQVATNFLKDSGGRWLDGVLERNTSVNTIIVLKIRIWGYHNKKFDATKETITDED
jgi:hypothetical protein